MGFYEEITKDKWKLSDTSLYPPFSKAEIRIELTNICNHRCLFCPNSSMKRKRQFIDDGLMYRILDDCRELGIKKAAMFLNGEPFLNKHIAEYVRYAKESSGMEYVYITTNGGAATTEELMTAVFEAGVDSIKFSINGGPQTYKQVHGVDEYELALSHLKFAYDYRKNHGKKYRILSGFVATNESQYEYEEHYKRIEPYIDDSIFVRPINMGGQVVDKLKNSADKLEDSIKGNGHENAKLPCALLFTSIVVTAEGFLTTCCEESFGNNFVVDLNDKSLKEAWHSDEMAAIRKSHIEKRVEGTQCYNCMFNAQEPVKPLNIKLYNAAQL